MNNERNPNVDIIPIGNIAGAATGKLPGLYMRKRSRIKNVQYADAADIAADAVNHLSISLEDNANNVLASGDSLLGLAKNVPLSLELASPNLDSVSQPEQDVPAGTMLIAKVVSHGTAVSTSAVLIVEWYPL